MKALRYYEVVFKDKTYRFRTQEEIAKAFGISKTLINLVINKKYKFAAGNELDIKVKYDEPNIEKYIIE